MPMSAGMKAFLKGATVFLAGALFAFLVTRYFDNKKIVNTLGADNGLGLQQVVEELRSELETMELRRLGNPKPAVFQLKDFDIELQVVAKVNDKASGKVEYEVVTAAMEHEIAHEATHKVTLHMALAPSSLLESSKPDPTLTNEGAQVIP